MPLHNMTVKETATYAKAVKKLKKRFRHIEDDCTAFIDEISCEADLGISLGAGIYKARIAYSDKKSGKSGGYRLISYLKLINDELYLLYIYDKSDFENVSEEKIDEMILASIH